MKSGATFSPCRKWRYTLWREWDSELPTMCVIGLNPSTADETKDDPTIRRCIGFARDWGFGKLTMLNIFAWRDTDPRGMKAAAEPVGADNDMAIIVATNTHHLTIAAWGVHGAFKDRGEEVRAMLQEVYHLGLTKDGHPKHPLYLPKSVKPVLWLNTHPGASAVDWIGAIDVKGKV